MMLIQKDFSSFFSAQTPGPGPAESELGLPAPWDSGWLWSDLVGLALPGIQKNSWLVVFDAKISTFLIPDTSSIFGIFHRAKGKFQPSQLEDLIGDTHCPRSNLHFRVWYVKASVR